LKKALAPKPRVTNQPAIHPDEAHKMLAIIKNTPGRKIVKIYTELLAHLFTRPSELRLAYGLNLIYNKLSGISLLNG